MLRTSPKQRRTPSAVGMGFAYYAGFSAAFVKEALDYLQLDTGGRIVDPWNGSGTTTEVADRLGYQALGFDLNPAAVLMARARLLRSDVRPSHQSIATEIVRAARRLTDADFLAEEPLGAWFSDRSATAIRGIERSIQQLLLPAPYARLGPAPSLAHVSPLAAHYFVALFRSIRRLVQPFRTSNPTWIRLPESARNRLRTTREAIEAAFQAEVDSLFAAVPTGADSSSAPKVIIDVGDSKALNLPDSSIDGVISSPPYCTRIDYAVSMKPELAALALSSGEFRNLRLAMLGSTIMGNGALNTSAGWGPTCEALLSTIAQHPAHGSKTYYLQTHQQYFSSLQKSLKELARVLRPGASAILVVQDSYYKEAHNNLPRIIEEMCASLGLKLDLQLDHRALNTKAAVNTRRLKYRRTADATESVMAFRRAPSDSSRGSNVN